MKMDGVHRPKSSLTGQIFSDRTNLRKVIYGIILQFSVQMTGVSAIQYYAG